MPTGGDQEGVGEPGSPAGGGATGAVAQATFLAELERNHDHNTRMNVLDGMTFAVAFACIVPGTVVTSFLTHYTSSKFLLNMPVFFSNIVFAVMPFVMSFVTGRYHRKKPVLITLGIFQRIAWIPVLLSVVLLRDRPTVLLPLFFACYLLYYLLWGSTSLFWREMMGRVFHPARQTSAMGLRESVGNIAGSVAGVGVMAVLSRVAFPRNFHLLFACYLLFYTVCLVWFARIREAPAPAGAASSAALHLRSLLELPRRDPVFRWFVVFVLLSYGTLFTGSLYTTIGIERFGARINSDRLAGLMTLLMLVSNSVFALILGRLADRKGRFWGYLPPVILGAVLPIWAAVVRTPLPYLALFLLLGAPNSAWFIELYATLGFAPPERRHLYIAYLSLLKIVPITLYINLGGWMAESISPVLTLVLSSVFCLAGLAVLVLKLRPHWTIPA